MEGNVQYVVKQVSKYDGKNADYFWELYFKLRASLSLYSKLIFKSFKGCSGHRTWTTVRRPLARVGMMLITTCSASSISRHPAQLSLSCRGLK